MGSHKSADCRKKSQTDSHRCAKCYHSNIDRLVKGHNTHNSASDSCPVIQREIKRLENNTELASKNVM